MQPTDESPMALALAQQLQTFETEEALRALVANAAPLLEVKAPDATEIREARLTLYRARTGIERQRKALNEDALKWTRQVNARAKDLSAIVSPTEEGLKRIENRLEAEAQEAERRRVDEVEARFAAIGAPGAIPRAVLARMSPEDIAAALDSEERRVVQEKAAREAAERARREAEEQRERELAEAKAAREQAERELAEARAALAEQRRRDAEAAAQRERLAREVAAPAAFQAPAPPVAVEPVAPPEPEGDLPVTEEVAPEDEPWARVGANEEPAPKAEGPNWTPGPWRVEHTYLDCDAVMVPRIQVVDAHDAYVSEHYAHDDPRAQATAHLIAAAPDLYEALDRVMLNHRTPCQCGDGGLCHVCLATAALAKARGEVLP